jgi:threonine dehydratase
VEGLGEGLALPFSKTLSERLYNCKKQEDGVSDTFMQQMFADLYAEVVAAEERIRPYARETPLEYSALLSQRGQGEVYLKLENVQHTGSFKLRGALNKLLSLAPEQRQRGVVTASSGNHGAAVAYGLRLLDIPGVIFVPKHAAPSKVDMIRRLGGEVRFYGDDGVDTELHARAYAAEQDMVYISPYNDVQVLAGQGTIGVELARQVEQLDAVFVAVGGGGLISGIAAYLKTVMPGVTIVGCQPERSAVMAASVRAGQIVELESLPTLSDGTAGGIEPGAVTFDPCRALVDEFVLVGEDAIADAIRLCLEGEHVLVEGAAGVAVAAYVQRSAEWVGRRVAIVICGANIGIATLKSVLGG